MSGGVDCPYAYAAAHLFDDDFDYSSGGVIDNPIILSDDEDIAAKEADKKETRARVASPRPDADEHHAHLDAETPVAKRARTSLEAEGITTSVPLTTPFNSLVVGDKEARVCVSDGTNVVS